MIGVACRTLLFLGALLGTLALTGLAQPPHMARPFPESVR